MSQADVLNMIARALYAALPGFPPSVYMRAARDMLPLFAAAWDQGKHARTVGDRNPYGVTA